ncbi:DinB family protein [Singulisphaera sp. Ch08]|uniref:DinB family protein n=1 Tax=Singulisphaera sp. Ch08 TaxID=3120278 RepID=A0AAU7CAZ3_9BACT
MSFGKAILPEFEQEMANTRKVLERIPDDKLDWKAHPKSNTIGWVGAHLAEIPGWVPGTLRFESWDINPEGGRAIPGPEGDQPPTASRDFRQERRGSP